MANPDRYVEAKGTSLPVPVFHLTEFERRFALSNAGRYSIVVVSGIDPESGEFERLVWTDGAVDDEMFDLTPTDWSVVLRSATRSRPSLVEE